MDIDTYKRILAVNGTSNADARLKSTINIFNSKFSDSLSYYQVYINNSPTPTGVQIIDDSELKEQKVILTQSTKVLGFGDLIKWNSDYWLNTIVDNMSNAYYRGVIRRCSDSIKWQDEKGNVQEAQLFPTTDVSRTLGVNQDNYLIWGNERRYIAIQSNPDTMKIAKGKRFIFDGVRCWRVTSIDALHTGLIYIILEECQIDPATDNVGLRVCDYVAHTYTIAITNGSSASLNVNSTLQLNVNATDNGTAITSPALTYTSNNVAIATVSSTGLIKGVSNGSVTITVALTDHPSVTATININVVAVVTHSYAVSITSTSTTPNEIKNGQSKTYNSVVSDNGTQITDGSQPVTWELYGDDQVSTTTLASITSKTGSSCTIHNNNASSGYIQLKCILQSNPTVFSWIRIQMKSLM